MAADRRKDIPTPSAGNYDARMREEMMRGLGRMGDRFDRFVTVGDLSTAGVIIVDPNWQGGGNVPPIVGPGTGPGSNLPPPMPTGFEVSAGIANLIIEHDPPVYTNGGGHARTLVYGAKVANPGDPLPTFANASPLCDFTGAVGAYPTEPATTWRLWIKWQSRSGLLSVPAGGTNGLSAETGQDVSNLINALTAAAEDPSSPYTKLALRADLIYVASETGPTDAGLFSVVTTPITNNGVVVPVGVYMRDLFVMNGVITNAKIGNLAVDNAKIASVSAAKITAGSIQVGEYIESTGFVSGSVGYRIDGIGNAEFSNAIVRGTVVANAGFVGGIVIDSNAVRSANYNALSGVGFRLGADGTLKLPNGSITAGSISVSSLSAITATLGDVAAGSVRGGAFTGFGWPASGGGFYLGPSGLLLGNFNTGQWFEALSNGEISMPGMRVTGGVLQFQQAAAIDTNNIVIGAVTIGLSGAGTDDATVFLTVPPGETWNILVVASYAQSNNVVASVGGSAAESCVRTSTLKVDGVVIETLPLQEVTRALSVFFGPYYYYTQVSTYKALSLGSGFHTLKAECAYDTYPLYDSSVSLIGYAFKR